MSLMAGHPQEASGEGSCWAAVSDRGSLHPEEERGRGAHRPRQQNCEFVHRKRIILFQLDQNYLWLFVALQEKRRAERAEQQRVRAEREKERQARLMVRPP